MTPIPRECQALAVAKSAPRELSDVWKVVTAKLSEREWSETELAAEVGIPKATLSRWKYADSFPSRVDLEHLTDLANYIGVSLDQLVGLKAVPPGRTPVGKMNLEERRLVDWFRGHQSVRDSVRPLMKTLHPLDREDDQE